jgi:hypothetical protein
VLKSPRQMGLRLSNSQCKSCSKNLRHPDSKIKSSTDDFVLSRSINFGSKVRPANARIRTPACGPIAWLNTTPGLTPDIFVPHSATSTDSIVDMPGRDSDLEAFSLNPSDGSFAALDFRPAT